jgi:hypothetical protein
MIVRIFSEPEGERELNHAGRARARDLSQPRVDLLTRRVKPRGRVD